MFGNMGLALYDHSTNKYLWRLTPPDDAAGLAMALWAHKRIYARCGGVRQRYQCSGNCADLVSGVYD